MRSITSIWKRHEHRFHTSKSTAARIITGSLSVLILAFCFRVTQGEQVAAFDRLIAIPFSRSNGHDATALAGRSAPLYGAHRQSRTRDVYAASPRWPGSLAVPRQGRCLRHHPPHGKPPAGKLRRSQLL